ncbi:MULTISPECIES: flagellar protein FlaG [Amphritea]|jgi:flagellar protein FlaG|uniref:Flagellar protein FlaG n=2 Tax=Amphritea TaxID=515417 RepID=A0A1H9L9G5_9GAMM|nr:MULTISPECIES: flagellar protein FlaG [Amphritea]MBN0986810.1 flagellar protein FlaG [Amphritea pacifica]MBN1005251.1 flagellar protein FlaG [Amphritea pacifica]SER07948.1 flagellar protein FlaG [Amphritea atlantica]
MSSEMQVSSTQATAKPTVDPSANATQTQQAQQPQQSTVQKPAGPSPADFSQQSVEALHETVAAINDFMSQFQRTLNFSVDQEGGQTIIKVIDKSNDELIRQIPSEDFIEISKHIEQMNNLLFSEKA